MTMGIIRRAAIFAAVAASTLTMTAAHAQKTMPVKPGGAGMTGQQPTGDPLARAKALWKAQFGFSDAQADAMAKKAMVIAKAYQPKFIALQKKYGANPTPAMVEKRNAEAIPLITEVGKKTSAALLSIATKEQKPRILQMVKMEQQRLDAMAKGGAARGGAAKPK